MDSRFSLPAYWPINLGVHTFFDLNLSYEYLVVKLLKSMMIEYSALKVLDDYFTKSEARVGDENVGKKKCIPI